MISPMMSASRAANESILWPPPAINIGGVRSLDGFGETVQFGNPVMLTAEGERRRAEQTLDHRDRLDQPADPHAGRIKRNTRLGIVRTEIAGPQPELQSPIGQEIYRRGLLRQDGRVPVVVVEDEAAHPEVARRVCGGDQSGKGCQLVVEVIRQEERRISQILNPAGECGVLGRRGRVEASRTKPKTTVHEHADRSSLASLPRDPRPEHATPEYMRCGARHNPPHRERLIRADRGSRKRHMFVSYERVCRTEATTHDESGPATLSSVDVPSAEGLSPIS